MGFIQQSDMKRLAFWNGYGWNLNDHSWINNVRAGFWTAKRWESSSNRLANFEANPFLYISAKSGISIFSTPIQHEEDYLFEEWEFSDDVTIPAQKYNMNRFWMSFDSGNASDYRYSFQTTIGDFYGGSIFSINPSINYIFSQHFNAELGVNYNNIDFPKEFSSTGKTDESRTVFTSRFNYAFSPTTSLKALMQYDNVSESLGSNIRLRYNPIEGTDFYLVYNQNYNTNRFTEIPVLPAIQNQSLILKFSHTFIY